MNNEGYVITGTLGGIALVEFFWLLVELVR